MPGKLCFNNKNEKMNGEDEYKTLAPKCTRTPPQTPNVFSDGSWHAPTKRFLSLGGTGVWWPGRNILRNEIKPDQYCMPLSHGEKGVANWIRESDALTLFSKVGGFSGSSTRTELSAAIISLAANGPIHLASDSEGFVNMANALKNKIAKCKDHKIKCKMHND